MKSDKRQVFIMIGITLLVIAGILVSLGFMQPRVYEEPSASNTSTNQNSELQEQSTEAISSVTVSQNVVTVQVSEQTSVHTVKYPINLNTATVDDLMTLEGIGEKRAIAIINYRSQIGKYISVEQIMEADGVGKETYIAIGGYLTV